MSERRDAIVIGGGVSGLAAAFNLARAGVAVTLLEGTERGGGGARDVRGRAVEPRPRPEHGGGARAAGRADRGGWAGRGASAGFACGLSALSLAVRRVARAAAVAAAALDLVVAVVARQGSPGG